MTQAPPPRTTRTWIWAVVLLVLLGLRLSSFARPAGGDQNLYTYTAQRVLQGNVPYRDAWDQKPPAIFFVYAAFWRAWPHDSMVALADLVAAGLTAWLLVRLGRRAFGDGVGEGAAAIFLLLGDPGIQRLGGMFVRAQCETFIALAVTAALTLTWRDSERPRHLVLAGACLALAFWLKYNAILFALPIGLAGVLYGGRALGRRRVVMSLAALAGGALGVGLVVLAYFAAAGALTDLWLATVSYNVQYSRETYAGPLQAAVYVVTLPFERAHVDGLWFVGLLGGALLLRFGRPGRASLIVFAWIGSAVLSIALNGSRGLPQYLLQAAPALALAASAGLATAWRQRHRARLVTAATGLLLALGAWRIGVEIVPAYQPRMFGLPQAARNLAADLRYLRGQTPRATYLDRFDRGEGGKFSPLAVERLAARVQEISTPADRIYVFGFSGGGVLVRAERQSASRFFWSRPVVLEFAADHPGYGSAGLLDDLRRTRPAIVALQKHDWGLAEADTPDSIRFFMTHAALRAWLEAGYTPDYEDDVYAVWRRKS